MEKHWDMSPASVLISITGGAQDFVLPHYTSPISPLISPTSPLHLPYISQDFVLPPRLNKAFRHGLAKAAQARYSGDIVEIQWRYKGGLAKAALFAGKECVGLG